MKSAQEKLRDYERRYFENIRKNRIKAANEIHHDHKKLMTIQLRKEIKLERRA